MKTLRFGKITGLGYLRTKWSSTSKALTIFFTPLSVSLFLEDNYGKKVTERNKENRKWTVFCIKV